MKNKKNTYKIEKLINNRYLVKIKPYKDYLSAHECTVQELTGEYADGSPLYEDAGFSGHLQFGGCIDWHFDESLHFCRVEDIKDFYDLMVFVQETADKIYEESL